MNSIDPEQIVAGDKTDEREKEDVQGLFPAVTTDEATEKINSMKYYQDYLTLRNMRITQIYW